MRKNCTLPVSQAIPQLHYGDLILVFQAHCLFTYSLWSKTRSWIRERSISKSKIDKNNKVLTTKWATSLVYSNYS